MSRANEIKVEQETLVAGLTNDDLFKQLWRKVLDVFTHKTEPSYMSIPVNYETDDDCYVSLRLEELKRRLDVASTEVREAYFAGFMAARAMEGGTPKHHTAIAAYGGSKYCASGKRDG